MTKSINMCVLPALNIVLFATVVVTSWKSLSLCVKVGTCGVFSLVGSKCLELYCDQEAT